jgi:hypothetical protein
MLNDPLNTKRKERRGLFLLCLFFAWNNILLVPLPTGSLIHRMMVHLPVALIFFMGLLLLLKKYQRDRIAKRLFQIYFLMLLVAIFRRDIARALEYTSLFGGYIGFWMLANVAPLTVRDLFRVFVFWALPLSIIVALTGAESGLIIPFAHGAMGNTWLMIRSVHYTSVFFSILALASLIMYQSSKRKGYLVTLALSFLAVILCRGRASLVALAITSAIYLFLVYKKVILKKHTFLILIASVCAVVSLYFVPLFMDEIKLEGFWGERLKMTQEHKDITAGRRWLWEYHLLLFRSNLWTGGSAADVNIGRGEYVQWSTATGASESFFTKVLARDGIFGFVTFCVFIWLLYEPLKRNNLTAFIIILLGMITTAGLSTLGSSYSIFAFIFYWWYFSALINPQTAIGFRTGNKGGRP